jgi:hypothetical protein
VIPPYCESLFSSRFVRFFCEIAVLTTLVLLR